MIKRLTDDCIRNAINESGIYFGDDEPLDNIRMAYEWLDAQQKTKRLIPKSKSFHANSPTPRKLCMDWCGWYMCENAFAIAAYIHPEIRGQHPRFNISTKFTLPSLDRISGLKGIIANDHYHRSIKFHKRVEV